MQGQTSRPKSTADNKALGTNIVMYLARVAVCQLGSLHMGTLCTVHTETIDKIRKLSWPHLLLKKLYLTGGCKRFALQVSHVTLQRAQKSYCTMQVGTKLTSHVQVGWQILPCWWAQKLPNIYRLLQKSYLTGGLKNLTLPVGTKVLRTLQVGTKHTLHIQVGTKVLPYR